MSKNGGGSGRALAVDGAARPAQGNPRASCAQISRKFTTVDSYVHQRLARLASIKYGMSRRNWSRENRFNLKWLSGLGVYRLTGTVRRRAMAHA